MTRSTARTAAALTAGLVVGAAALGGIATAAPSNGGGGGSTPTTTTVVNTDAQPVPVKGTVNVGNLPATQPVSGSVQVSNLPATQNVVGTVNIGNLPATQSVTVANTTPLQVRTAAPETFTKSFVNWSANAEHFGEWTVPDGRTAVLETASFSIAVPQGRAVTSASVYTNSGAAAGAQFNVPLVKQGTRGGEDIYAGTTAMRAYFPAGTKLTFAVAWDAPGGLAFATTTGAVSGTLL